MVRTRKIVCHHFPFSTRIISCNLLRYFRFIGAQLCYYTAMERCEWANGSELEQSYHDTEWGRAIHDDKSLFEFLILEGAQAGLSWSTILKKREGYRKAFDNFDAWKISQYSEDDVARLLVNAEIIRNRRKIMATITNAKAFLQV